MQAIDNKVLSRIQGLGRGAVVIPSRFSDLGSRQAIDVSLHRLARRGTIRRNCPRGSSTVKHKPQAKLRGGGGECPSRAEREIATLAAGVSGVEIGVRPPAVSADAGRLGNGRRGRLDEHFGWGLTAA